MSTEVAHTITLCMDDLDEWPHFRIECPYRADDPDRPCRMFADAESDDPQDPIDGCGLIDHYDGGELDAIAMDGELHLSFKATVYWDNLHPVFSPFPQEDWPGIP